VHGECRLAAFASVGAAVFGVNGDGAASHERFIAKLGWTMPLLIDPGLSVAKAYDAVAASARSRSSTARWSGSIASDASRSTSAVCRHRNDPRRPRVTLPFALSLSKGQGEGPP